MDIEIRKLQFIREILSINDEQVIDRLEALLKKEQKNLNPMLKEKLTTRALKANKEIEAGEVYSREEVEANLKKSMGI
ncbi:MAG: hypothetical protein AAFN93_17055 [Bacteroidota bacterium]